MTEIPNSKLFLYVEWKIFKTVSAPCNWLVWTQKVPSCDQTKDAVRLHFTFVIPVLNGSEFEKILKLSSGLKEHANCLQTRYDISRPG
jgi:hypothetical protein